MYKQLIFCVEADEKSRTDWVYINDTIKKYYQEDNEIKYTPIFMGAKMNYDSRRVIGKVNKSIKEYTHGSSFVFYCIDVDSFESNPTHIREFEDIENYCKVNGYNLIWFCHDIEDVYLNKRVHKKEKSTIVKIFRSGNLIDSIDEKKLMSENNHRIHSSNILSMLDDYIDRK